jgi:hypothetical protein
VKAAKKRSFGAAAHDSVSARSTRMISDGTWIVLDGTLRHRYSYSDDILHCNFASSVCFLDSTIVL